MANHKQITCNHSVKYSDEYNEYTFQLVRRRKPWWLLLLLLPLLLFIKCKHDITVTTVDAENNIPVEDIDVTLGYHSRFLYSDGAFAVNNTNTLTQKTDSNGVTVFKDLECSVFSYIFYCMEQCSFSIKSDCYTLDPTPTNKNFHYTRKVTLPLVQKKTDVIWHVVDKETEDQLAGAKVEIEYQNYGKKCTASGTTTPAGEVTFKDIPECGIFDFVKGSCHGYIDSTLVNRPVKQVINSVDSATIKLEPLKTRFTFFVKNRLNKQPVAGADCTVTLTHNGVVRSTGKVQTNTSGEGMAAYNDAFVLAKIEITAVATNYKPGKLDDDYTVEEFIKLPDSLRVIWLDPEPLAVDFQLVDLLTGALISGASVDVTVTDGKGDAVKYPTVTSNANGKFPVKACVDDKVHIHAERSPMFKPKDHIINKFKKGEVIKMSPNIIKLNFRTLDAKTMNLLPNCNLSITTSHSRLTKPSNSGSTGEFTFEVYKGETLSVTASKTGYGSKSLTNMNTAGLETAPQSSRDLPLKRDMIRYSYNGSPQGKGIRNCYDLKSDPVTFIFSLTTICNACSVIKVVDDNGNVLGTYTGTGTYTLTSSTRNVCVFIDDENGHQVTYTIETK